MGFELRAAGQEDSMLSTLQYSPPSSQNVWAFFPMKMEWIRTGAADVSGFGSDDHALGEKKTGPLSSETDHHFSMNMKIAIDDFHKKIVLESFYETVNEIKLDVIKYDPKYDPKYD